MTFLSEDCNNIFARFDKEKYEVTDLEINYDLKRSESILGYKMNQS